MSRTRAKARREYTYEGVTLMPFKGAVHGDEAFGHIITALRDYAGENKEFLAFPLKEPDDGYDDSHIVLEAPLPCWHCGEEKKVSVYKGALAAIQLSTAVGKIAEELFGDGAMVFVRICGICRNTGLFAKAKWYRQECVREARGSITRSLCEVYGRRLIRVKVKAVSSGVN